jgi:hypothetical protein
MSGYGRFGFTAAGAASANSMSPVTIRGFVPDL